VTHVVTASRDRDLMTSTGKIYRIVVINPGSTSTKLAVYENEKPLFDREIIHSVSQLNKYRNIVDQLEFREELIIDELARAGLRIEDLDAIIGRGGALEPLPSGTYLVNERMIEDLKSGKYGLHASNLGALLARRIAERAGLSAYIIDPITVSEMSDVAKVSGIPDIERESIFHALNQKAVARRAAEDLELDYNQTRFIVVHLGGGISVGAHECGRVVDVNNALNGDGPFAPTRSGGIPVWSLIRLACSGKYAEAELGEMVMKNGGIASYLGTSDMREVCEMIEHGDQKARLLYEAMAYQVAKEVGCCAAVLKGNVDAIVLSGGLARDMRFVNLIKERVAFIARILIYPGSDEMRALALGALRVLTGEETAKEY